jgi:hypothetical protein
MRNHWWITQRLAEARDELDALIAHLGTAPDDDVELAIGLQHAYAHINTAWNSRALPADRLIAFTPADYVAWRAVPSEIDPTL